jgi:hypothetical protein
VRRIGQCLGVLAVIALAAGIGAGSASAATQRITRTREQWQAALAKAPERGTGCYHASYPALQWHAVKCAVAPKLRMAPALRRGPATRAGPAIIGNGHDYSARVSGLISQATGSFHGVSPGITEKGKVDNEGAKKANAFSLQLNTGDFSTPACSGSGDPSNCQGWQQFVYAYQSRTTGDVFMQYWLLNYDASCPPGWFSYADDCYTNSSASTVTGGPLTAADLTTVNLSGSATSGGNDEVSLSAGSGQAALVANSDSMLDLAGSWNTTEWGVYGDGGGGEAYFGTDTTLEAQTVLTATSSSPPACVKHGFTGETNNLNLANTAALGSEPSPTMISEQTNGTTAKASCSTAGWTATEAPVPANAASDPETDIYSVACAAPTSCIAVGSYDGPGYDGLLLTGSGTSWTATEAPMPGNAAGDPEATLNAVACASSGPCVAVGSYTDTAGDIEGVLLTDSSGSWAPTQAPLPTKVAGDPDVTFNAVACSSDGTCAAAGYYYTPSGASKALLDSSASSSWTAAKITLPANASPDHDAGLYGIGCPSSGPCVAGGYYATSPDSRGLLITGSGTSWQATEAPLPPQQASVTTAGFSTIACPSAATCSAIGSYSSSGNYTGRGMAVTGSGTSWTASRLPVPGGTQNPDGNFNSIACPSTATCVIAGTYANAAGTGTGMLITGSGTTWTAVKAPLPPDTTGELGLSSVACPSITWCTVVGDIVSVKKGILYANQVLVIGSGASWNSVEAPLPDNAIPSSVSNLNGASPSVACTSTIACITTNAYSDTNGNDQGLLVSGPG